MFFALAMDRALDAALDAQSADLVAVTEGRPVPACSRHATLAFIGMVPRAEVARLAAIGASLPGALFDLALDTIGAFKGARVAWIGPSTVPPALVALHTALAQRLRDDGFPVDARAYHAHVTLARHCRRTLASRRVATIAWPVRSVVLYESITAPQGPRYEPRAQWALSGS
jgi:2'-5' RNA ligase